MNSIYVLIVVLSLGGSPGTRPAAFTQEFFSLKTCNEAALIVRNSNASVTLAVCTEK